MSTFDLENYKIQAAQYTSAIRWELSINHRVPRQLAFMIFGRRQRAALLYYAIILLFLIAYLSCGSLSSLMPLIQESALEWSITRKCTIKCQRVMLDPPLKQVCFINRTLHDRLKARYVMFHTFATHRQTMERKRKIDSHIST